ncbi:hypothetical protein L3X38_010837 [Prunus dulcis]|uniref:Uncharacterized protein n=1 Tax=Prunus dulcis TaxID=3755 RepID=A0AAD4WIR1_PRUDU|nr:hypothetical protein L3X38_010837 [Prunus dulcis]
MLAVSASEDGIKVLENAEGVQPPHSLENHGVFAFDCLPELPGRKRERSSLFCAAEQFLSTLCPSALLRSQSSSKVKGQSLLDHRATPLRNTASISPRKGEAILPPCLHCSLKAFSSLSST